MPRSTLQVCNEFAALPLALSLLPSQELRSMPRGEYSFLAYDALDMESRVQDIYAFDVGDFGKIGFLRHLCRQSGLSLGVLWYRTNLGTAGADGEKVAYLNQPRFRFSDPELWDEMRRRFDPDKRTIAALCPLFPANTTFHDEAVPVISSRRMWFQEATTTVSECDVVFCDPDNGVVFDGPCRSVAHVSLEEIETLFEAGHSLVVYHHPNRSKKGDKHDAQIQRALGRFMQALPKVADARGAWFRRGTSRVFFVLMQERHAQALARAVDEMESMPWCQDGHFKIIRSTEQVARTKGSFPDYAQPRKIVEQVVDCFDATLPSVDDVNHAVLQQAGEGLIVTVVLNDNGGLNLAANPWLDLLEVPCRLESRKVAFSVEAPFSGRHDMYRVSPSALSLARHYGFAGAHLSKQTPVVFEAAIEGCTPDTN